MGIFNLDDNMIVQVVAFALTLLCWVVWFFAMFWSDNFTDGTWHLPAVADGIEHNHTVCIKEINGTDFNVCHSLILR